MPQSAPKRARSRLSTRFIPSPLARGGPVQPGVIFDIQLQPAIVRLARMVISPTPRCCDVPCNGVLHDRLQGKGRQLVMRQPFRHRHLDLQVSLKASLSICR